MANWHESFQHKPLEFRAPPPSPVASGRRSSVANDEILTEFLHHSLRVPDLILPNHISPSQKFKFQKLPKLDYKTLKSIEDHNNNIANIATTGCFELVNHGISDQIVRSVAKYGAGIFELSPEKKSVVSRSGDMMYGFDEFHGEERETSEEFVWCRDDALNSKLEAILPFQCSNLSENLEILTSEIEKISGIILKFLLENVRVKSGSEDDDASEEQIVGTICCFHKHHDKDPNGVTNDNQYTNTLRYDMIRMLIRGSEYSHTLCVHACHGSSEFHVYSKKGWVSFLPEEDALVITIGDQLQRLSEGKYKHVMGRPVFKGEEDYISMAFLYNPPPTKEKKISLGHQILLFSVLVLFYKFFL